MPILSAQNNFKRGLTALLDDNPRDAVVFFRRALDIEGQRQLGRQPGRQHGRQPGHAAGRCLSYYGLSLAMLSPTHPEALAACRRAADDDCSDPDVFLNLARVCLLSGRRAEALQAFERGLLLDPEHPVLRRERNRFDRRRSPVVGRLHRDHPVNVWLGRLRAQWVSPVPTQNLTARRLSTL